MEEILDVIRRNRMEASLDDMRRDAIEKLKTANNEDSQLLIDSAIHILTLSMFAREEGLLPLEFVIQNFSSDFLKLPILLIVDAFPPEEIIEITSNEYWTRDPQGVQAMIAYFYIRGTLYIQEGCNPKLLKDILKTLIPLNWRQKYQESWEKAAFNETIDEWQKIIHRKN